LKKLVIIKTGSTFESISKTYGDFEDLFINKLGKERKEILIVDAVTTQKFPRVEEISGIIITGSHSMITDNEEWMQDTSNWLKQFFDEPVPILGVCFGHQLLAKTFGGEVGYHPGGKELGVVEIKLTAEGKKDKLLSSLSETFFSYAAHSQTVLSLPPGAVLLAQNGFEKHHAFCLNNHIWGVQFHPEFTAGVVKMYIHEFEKELLKEGVNTKKLYDSINELSSGQVFLSRFCELSQ
jgi:GMP synthase (glutamine-hydrolysing)